MKYSIMYTDPIQWNVLSCILPLFHEMFYDVYFPYSMKCSIKYNASILLNVLSCILPLFYEMFYCVYCPYSLKCSIMYTAPILWNVLLCIMPVFYEMFYKSIKCPNIKRFSMTSKLDNILYEIAYLSWVLYFLY